MTKPRFISENYSRISSLCAGNIDTMEDFERLKDIGGYRFYEGKFYRVPITKGQTDVAPLKGNYIDLLNIVNSPDFELTTAADIISRDTALPIDLLKMVQPLAVNSELHLSVMRLHAGTAGTEKVDQHGGNNALYADKPNEDLQTFSASCSCENLAKRLAWAQKDGVPDGIVLRAGCDPRNPAEALKVVHVAGEISNALIYRISVLAPIITILCCK